MIFWLTCIGGVAVAYLLGATPTGYLAGRMLRGIDIREHGSRSTGATNVLRILGKGPALVVLLVAVLKGVAAILFARWFYAWLGVAGEGVAWAVCLCGLAVLLGHSRSLWLGFTGGKSAATGLGVLMALSWPVDVGAASVFLLVLAVGRIVSLASMLAAVTAALLVCLLPEPLPYRLLVIAGGLYVIVLHRANIARLLSGTEPKIGRSLAR